ncbi:MAG: hypothetical protein GY771_08755 [bacterium]|nr:hypothetical protein [bacterium]
MTESKDNKKRVCVVGLDGVPFTLLRDLTQKGIMPNMAKLAETGHLRPMTVTLPEISSVSWPSYITGTGPGGHGIFGFSELKPNSYDLRFTNFNDLKAPPLWDKLRDDGKRSVVINLPGTYPARPVNGALIAGFVAIDLTKAVYPLTVYHELKKFDYQVDIDIVKCRKDHDLLQKHLADTLGYRRKAVDLLWDGDWDFFQVVVTGTDRLHHFLFTALINENHHRHEMVISYYKEVDRFIGEMYERFSVLNGTDDDGFYMLSDHGFCAIEQEVNLNTWLRDNGYLEFESDDFKTLNQITANSKAFAMDPSRIYINRKGKYPKGMVEEGDGERILGEIASGLKEIKYNGESAMRDVFRRDEVYSGPYTENGPDLIALSHHGFDLKASTKPSPLFRTTPQLVGMHNFDDAFFWSKGEQKGDFNIVDIAAIILDGFDVKLI